MVSMSFYVINDKTKIKYQLQTSYSIIVCLSAFVTLGICYLLLFALYNSTNHGAGPKITTQTVESVVAVSVEISNSINQQLAMISDNIVLNTVLMSTILINYSNMSSVNGPLLNPIPTYRDYNFVPGCQFPKCPSDYYSPSSNVRLPRGYVNGSLSHPSIVLFSDRHKQAVRNDSFWDQVVTESPEINNVVNGLAIQDHDMRLNYRAENTENASCMYYLTARIENMLTATTNIVHRIFPGILVDADIVDSYNPTQKEWFQQAPINALYLTGPYLLSMTNTQVIILSSKKTVDFPAGSRNEQFITFVSAGMMSLERLAQAVSGFQYTDGGFGAVMNSDMNEVLFVSFFFVSISLFINLLFRCWSGKITHTLCTTTQQNSSKCCEILTLSWRMWWIATLTSRSSRVKL
jgi:hypothetical protein